MSARLAGLLALVLAAAGCRTAARQGVVPAAAASAAGVPEWEPVTRHLVDSAGARLAALELQRLALEGAGAGPTEQAQTVRRQIAVLERQLAEVPRPEAAARLAASQVLRALDAREAGLLVERRQLLVTYTAANHRVEQVDAEARALARRRAELEAIIQVARAER